MSFNIILMRNNSEVNKLTKITQDLLSVSGTLKEQTSIIDPVIKIQADLSALKYCNYMYIAEFGRYYFVNDIKSVTGSIIEVSGHVDVLSTYAQQIRSNTAITRRQENNWNLYLNDGTFRVYQDPKVITKAFPSGFTTQELVLAVAGS